jgi:hypothetical protein
MTRTVLTSGLFLCGGVGAALTARDWSVLATGIVMLHASVPATMAAYVLGRRPDPPVVTTFALGAGTGFAPAATVLWASILLGGGPSGGSALWISYVLSAVASAVLITVYASAYGLLVGDDVAPMMKGFAAAAAPIPAGAALTLLLPETGARAAVLTLAIGLPVGWLAYDRLGPFARSPDPNGLDDTAGSEGLSARIAGKVAATFACALAAGMGLVYMFNDPTRGGGAGLGLSGGLGLCALAIVLGPATRERTQGVDLSGWTRGGLAAGGIVLVLLSFAASGPP